MARRPVPQSKAAYTLVDLSGLDEDIRKDLIEDANAGGGLYGIRVVEESVFGGARAPIYGVYNDGPDADRWAQAKKDLGISSSKVDDASVAAASAEVTDPRRAAAIREAAAQSVEAQAARIRAGEDAEIAAITGGDTDAPAPARAPALNHTANIVDDTLAPDAENEAANAENQEADETSSRSTRRNRTPR